MHDACQATITLLILLNPHIFDKKWLDIHAAEKIACTENDVWSSYTGTEI